MRNSETNRQLLTLSQKTFGASVSDVNTVVRGLIEILLSDQCLSDYEFRPPADEVHQTWVKEYFAQLDAFRDLAAEAKYYVDRWPKLAPDLLKRLAEMCPEGRVWNPTEEL